MLAWTPRARRLASCSALALLGCRARARPGSPPRRRRPVRPPAPVAPVRGLWVLRASLGAREIDRAGRPPAPQRLQHAAGPGARPRRGVLRERHRAARRPTSPDSFDPLAYAIASAAAAASTCTPGSTSTWSRAGDAATIAHPRRRAPPGMADGAAGARRRAARRSARVTRATSARSPRGRSTTRRRSRGSTASPISLTPSHLRRARRQRPRRALSARRRSPRLHPVSVASVRLRPGGARRLPRVAAARAVRRPTGSADDRLRRDPVGLHRRAPGALEPPFAGSAGRPRGSRSAARCGAPGPTPDHGRRDPRPRPALDHKLQDWRDWSRAACRCVCPMIYTTSLPIFIARSTAARQAAGAAPVWAGIGAYRLPTTQTIDHIARRTPAGAAGVVLFLRQRWSSRRHPRSARRHRSRRVRAPRAAVEPAVRRRPPAGPSMTVVD